VGDAHRHGRVGRHVLGAVGDPRPHKRAVGGFDFIVPVDEPRAVMRIDRGLARLAAPALLCGAAIALFACTLAATPATPRPLAAAAPTQRATPSPSATPRCVVPASRTAPPTLLVEHARPTPPPPPTRRVRRVIVLDQLDGYGPLQVSEVNADGVWTWIADGSDPRMLPDGTLVYVESPETSARALVTVAPDGTSTRRAGGAGRLAGLGGPVAASRAPFTRDGRHQLVLRGPCVDEGGGACALSLHSDDAELTGAPTYTRSLLLAESASTARLQLSDDGATLAACYGAADGTHFLRVEMATGSARETRVDGVCRGFDVSLTRALVTRDAAAVVVDLAGRETPLHTRVAVLAAAFDLCGESVFVVGRARDDAAVHRVERIVLATGVATTLLEVRSDTLDWAPFEALALDARGWLLVSSDVSAMTYPPGGAAAIRQPVSVWLIAVDAASRSPAPVALTLSGEIYGVHLGR